MSHVRVTYTVANTDHQGEHMLIDLVMPLINGQGGGRISLPWPEKGVDLKTYARERMHAKMMASLGADLDKEHLVDETAWPGQKTEPTPIREEPRTNEERSAKHREEEHRAKDEHLEHDQAQAAKERRDKTAREHEADRKSHR